MPNTFAGSMAAANPSPVCVFTKCLQHLDYDRLAETINRAGFDGADLSVRKGGHVLPAEVIVNLPKAINILTKVGLKVPMMVTDIKSADDPDIEKVLGTASQQGIKYYRMSYLNYEAGKTIPENLDIHKKAIERLEKINRKFNIHGEYQNHAGTRVGGPVWDVYWLLKDSDPAFIGSQYDIRHAVCEGGTSWSIGLKLLAPWIKTIAIKDFVWNKDNNTKWKIKDMPLGEGMVDYDAYLKEYVKLGISGPASVHYEYDLGGAESGSAKSTMSNDEILVCLKKDLQWIKSKFKEHGVS